MRDERPSYPLDSVGMARLEMVCMVEWAEGSGDTAMRLAISLMIAGVVWGSHVEPLARAWQIARTLPDVLAQAERSIER